MPSDYQIEVTQSCET